jgi:hypothetical protein
LIVFAAAATPETPPRAGVGLQRTVVET